MPATSRTGTTLPGEVGFAISGSSSREVDHLGLVVSGTGIGGERDVVVLASLRGEPLARPLVAREDGGVAPVSTIMLQIVARSVADRRRDAVSGELEDPPDASAHAVASQQLEDDVLRLHPGG